MNLNNNRSEEELRLMVASDIQNLKYFETSFPQTLKILNYVDVKKDATWLVGQIMRKSDNIIEVNYDGYDQNQNEVS